MMVEVKLTRKQIRELTYGSGLTEIAINVASTAIGSLERSRDRQDKDIAILQSVLRVWEPTPKWSKPAKMRFDATVKALICLALELAQEKTNVEHIAKG